MIVAAADLRRLAVRVAVVTIALRAVSMFSVDPPAREVSYLLPPVAASAEPGHVVAAALAAASGFAASARLPSLLAEVGVVLLLIAYARAAGWGTIAGLLAGGVAALAPLGLGAGWRADHGLAPLLLLAAMTSLRAGLRQGSWRTIGGGALAAAAAAWLTPAAVVVLPGALWQAARSVAMDRVRLSAAAAWSGAMALGLGLRAVSGGVGPRPDAMAALLGEAAAPAQASMVEATLSALAALSPGGGGGVFARAAELQDVPLWSAALGGLLALGAAVGFVRGLVREDPPDASREPAGGAAPVGWRTLGVAVAAAPRQLGERDALPLLMPVALAATLAGAALSGAWPGVFGDGAVRLALDAVAVARPLAVLALGAGLAGVALRPALIEAEPGPGGRRAVATLIALALLLFVLGGTSLLDTTGAAGTAAPRKVARFVADEVGGSGHAVLIGPGGLRLRWKLAGAAPSPRLHTVGASPAAALAAARVAAAQGAAALCLAGDAAALGGGEASLPPLGGALDAAVTATGYALVEDGHRYLGPLAVRAYRRDSAIDPATVRPQLAPGEAP